VQRGVRGCERHVVVPARAQVRYGVIRDLQLALACGIPIESDFGQGVEEAALVAEDPVEHRLRHAGGLAYRASGDVPVRGGHQLRLGRIEQRFSDGIHLVRHASSLADLISPLVSVLWWWA